MPTVDTLKVIELIADKIVELAYVLLFAYIARLAADFLKYRLEVLGPASRLFVPKAEADI